MRIIRKVIRIWLRTRQIEKQTMEREPSHVTGRQGAPGGESRKFFFGDLRENLDDVLF